MAKQYDRLINPFLPTEKQDITAFDDYLWRLKVALDRVQRIGPYRLALRKRTIDAVLEERKRLANYVQEWLGSDLIFGKMAFQLGPLRETLYQLEDMADEIEYMRWKQYQANSLIRRLRVVLKLRKTEEKLKDLQVIIEDFQKEFKSKEGKAMTTESMKGSTEKQTHNYLRADDSDLITKDQYISQGNDCCEICRNYAARQISEVKDLGEISQEIYPIKKFDGQHNVKEQLVEGLLKGQQGEDPVIPFDVAPTTKKVTIPVYDIFHDKKVREQFGLLLHVRASDESSHQGTLTESILKLMNTNVVNVQGALHTEKCGKCRCCWKTNVDKGRPPEEGSSNWSEREVVKELQKKFSQFSEQEEKFLLILEDVLEDQLPQLDLLLTELLSGNSGSRIVISSQSTEVLQSVHGVEISNDGNIKRDIFWNYFRSFAFRDEKGGEDEEMKLTAKMMAAHLEFFPLAAKMIAKMLNTKRDHQFWNAILRKLCHVVKIDCEHRRLLSLLKICYDQLPAPLRLCFQYCSLFPNDWTFTRQNLVRLWMSQGFLEDPNNKLEDVGTTYFDELFSRSFFEKIIDDNHTSLYRMHTSVHCFAQVTAGEEFMRIENDIGIRPEESLCARHLSVKSGDLSALYNVDGLFRVRTLIIFGPTKPDDRATLHHILPRLKNTRTLDLAGCDVNKFPEMADDLRKHLRFLSIYDTDIDKLPDDFCQFFHLQVLNVQGSRIKKLPPEMTRLCNLRHISGPTFLTSAVNHIGRLKDLQELEEFAVSREHKIQELGGIKDLTGSVSITNLEKVMFMDATKARLHEKSSIKSLKLEWSDKVMQRSSICGIKTLWIQRFMSANVLEHLKPSSDICLLEINRYIGDKSPSWFTDKVLLEIETIILRNCINLVESPPLSQLRRLKTLKMENWKKLRSFHQNQGSGDPGFQELIELSFEDMPELEVWADCDKSFPRLELLTIRYCPKLRKIPLLESPALKEIYVEEVGLEDLPLRINKQVETCTSPAQPESLKRLTMQGCWDLLKVGGNHDGATYLPSTLLYLRLSACKNIEHIGFKDPIFLEELHIDGCENLMKLAINNVKGDLTTLRTVHLDNISLLIPYCKQLVSLEELVIDGKGQIIDSLDELPNSSIRKLCLIRCQNESFFTKGEYKERPKDMEEFKSLKCLHLKQCYKMKSLPYLPYNLDELHIDECPLLEKHCRQDGPGWSSISHVPYKYI